MTCCCNCTCYGFTDSISSAWLYPSVKPGTTTGRSPLASQRVGPKGHQLGCVQLKLAHWTQEVQGRQRCISTTTNLYDLGITCFGEMTFQKVAETICVLSPAWIRLPSCRHAPASARLEWYSKAAGRHSKGTCLGGRRLFFFFLAPSSVETS